MTLLKTIPWEVWPILGLIGIIVMITGFMNASYAVSITGMIVTFGAFPLTTIAQKLQPGRVEQRSPFGNPQRKK